MEKASFSSKPKLACNYYSLKMSSKVFKYNFSIQPEITPNQKDLFSQVFRSVSKCIQDHLKTYILLNYSIYSPYQLEDFVCESNIENQNYRFEIKNTGLVSIEETHNIVGRLIRLIQGQMGLKPIQKKYFNVKNCQILPKHKLKIWPGYSTTVKRSQDDFIINVDFCHKIFRDITLLDYMTDLRNTHKEIDKVQSFLKGSTVVTNYNDFPYKFDAIETGLSPTSTFEASDGKQISFVEYYEKRYNRKISNKSQPLIAASRRNKKVYLIPELCYVSGLSEAERSNTFLKKDIDAITKKDVSSRMRENQSFFELIKSSESANKVLKEWDLNLENKPITFQGKVVDPGKIVGPDREVPASDMGAFEKVQSCSDDRKEVLAERTVIFYTRKDDDLCLTLTDLLGASLKQSHYRFSKPREVKVENTEWRTWEKAFRDNLNQDVQLVILILPGKKKNSPLYEHVKRYFLSEMPIPTQVVLSETIGDKKIKSIVHNILNQLSAKAGTTPWSINQLPVDQPTMIAGIHEQSKGLKRVIGFSGSVNRKYSRYYSTVKALNNPADREEIISGIIRSAMLQFSNNPSKLFPTRLIIYREGLAEYYLKEMEVQTIKKTLERMYEDKILNQLPHVFYIIVNKRTDSKFFNADGANLVNPSGGTVVDSIITDPKEFYLVSQNTRPQVTANPTLFKLTGAFGPSSDYGRFQDYEGKDIDKILQDLEVWTFKLCYLYYNWQGAIRMPAPLKYAEMLGNYICKLEKGGQLTLPHEDLENRKTLYFI